MRTRRFLSVLALALCFAALPAPLLRAEVDLVTPDPALDASDRFYADVAPLVAGAARTRHAALVRALMYERPDGEEFYNDETYSRWFFLLDGEPVAVYEHRNWTYFRREEGELVVVDVALLFDTPRMQVCVFQGFVNGKVRDEYVVTAERGSDRAAISRRTGGRVQYSGKLVSRPAPLLGIWTSFYYLDSARSIGEAGGVAVFNPFDETFFVYDATFDGAKTGSSLSLAARDRSKPVDLVARFGSGGLERVEWTGLEDVFFPVRPDELAAWRERLLPDVGFSSADIDTRPAEGVLPSFFVRSIAIEFQFERAASGRALSTTLAPGVYRTLTDSGRMRYAWSAGKPKYRDPTPAELTGKLVSGTGSIVVDETMRETAEMIAAGLSGADEIALAVARWVFARVEYSLEVISQDALATLENGRGDCSEFSDLVVSLLRSIGIPSMTVSGYYYDPQARDLFHHAWVAVWNGNRWVEIEATAGSLAMPACYVPSPFESWSADLEYAVVLEAK